MYDIEMARHKEKVNQLASKIASLMMHMDLWPSDEDWTEIIKQARAKIE